MVLVASVRAGTRRDVTSQKRKFRMKNINFEEANCCRPAGKYRTAVSHRQAGAGSSVYLLIKGWLSLFVSAAPASKLQLAVILNVGTGSTP